MGAATAFELIETLLWRPAGGFWLLDYHLARLYRSAHYFGLKCSLASIEAQLERHAAGLGAERHWRVRLALAPDGDASVSAAAMREPAASAMEEPIVISQLRVNSADRFLYHKTTRRELYDSEYARLTRLLGCAEVIFRNERGELSEGSRTTLFVEKRGALYTPAVSCGLLPGTFRRFLFDNPDVDVREAVLHLADLETADRLWIGNSVRGLVPVRLLTQDADAGQPRDRRPPRSTARERTDS